MLIKNGYVHSLHALMQKISANEGAGSVWKCSAALRSLTQRIYRLISNSDQATLRPKNAGYPIAPPPHDDLIGLA